MGFPFRGGGVFFCGGMGASVSFTCFCFANKAKLATEISNNPAGFCQQWRLPPTYNHRTCYEGDLPETGLLIYFYYLLFLFI